MYSLPPESLASYQARSGNGAGEVLSITPHMKGIMNVVKERSVQAAVHDSAYAAPMTGTSECIRMSSLDDVQALHDLPLVLMQISLCFDEVAHM